MEIEENEFRKSYMINPLNNEEVKVVFLKKIATETDTTLGSSSNVSIYPISVNDPM